MKFLVPTDFSENAFHAAGYALMFAKEKPGSSIHLLHVITPVLNDVALIPGIGTESTVALERIVKLLHANGGTCSISHATRIGEISREINIAAEELNAGVIVMGVRGLGKVSRFLFGSNTISLIDEASRPVLVVPETAGFNAPGRIVFATDYLDSDFEALEKLIPIAEAFNSEIVVAHVFEETNEGKSERSMMDFLCREIRKTIQYPRITYQVYPNKSVARGITSLCEFTEADLLVLSARKRNAFQRIFQKSATKSIIYNIDIPLLIYHTHR